MRTATKPTGHSLGWTRRLIVVASIPAAALLLGRYAGAGTADAKQIADGQRLYDIYCAACHGEKARGDGPTAAVLRVRPADLTGLAKKNKGTFPADDVHAAIDGRGVEHGTREMPLWGLAFQNPGSDVNQEADVNARIDALVAWLETIQR